MLSASRILDDARGEAGLDDFGDEAFLEGFGVLVDAVNTEAGLSPESEQDFRRHYLIRTLVNRLRMQRDTTRCPEILHEALAPPVFITCVPRTGSTKLHRMLAASLDFNSMKFWQAFNFAPFATEESHRPDPREAAAEGYLRWVRTRSPRVMDQHPMYSDETEEEFWVLDAGYNSPSSYATLLNVPSYAEWTMKRDPRLIFEDLRRILQYLQWQHFRGSGRRWVLKTPALLGLEGAFAEVFPGTDFIVTHRDPQDIVASCCALFTGFRQIFNDSDSSDVAGELVLTSYSQAVNAHLAWREAYPESKVLDVRFDDVVDNDQQLLPRIYEFLDMPLADPSRTRVESWVEMDLARRQVPQRFSLSDFGLHASQVDERFSAYVRRYGDYL